MITSANEKHIIQLEDINDELGTIKLDNGLWVDLGCTPGEPDYIFGEMPVVRDAKDERNPVGKYIENVIQKLGEQFEEDKEQLYQKDGGNLSEDYYAAVDELKKELKNNIKASQPKAIAEINETHDLALTEVLKRVDTARDDGRISSETHALWTELIKKDFAISIDNAIDYIDADELTDVVIDLYW